MLGKLIKYEIKATGRSLLPLYAVLLLFSVINRIFFTIDGSTALMNSFLAKIIMGLTVFLYGVVVAAVFVVTFFVLIQRFYKNLLGNEGYLMNTLPVQSWKHIVSKMIVAVLWSLASGIVITLSILVMSVHFSDLSQAFHNLGILFSQVWQNFGVSGYWAGIHFLLLCLLFAAVAILMIYASLALGHMANKHKILWSFGAFLGINFVSSLISSHIIQGLSNLQGLQDMFYSISRNPFNLTPVYTVLWIGTAFAVVFGAVFFFLTNYVMRNKLNLE